MDTDNLKPRRGSLPRGRADDSTTGIPARKEPGGRACMRLRIFIATKNTKIHKNQDCVFHKSLPQGIRATVQRASLPVKSPAVGLM